MNDNCYVYVYCDCTKPGNYKYDDYVFSYEPFYVGRGQRTRWQINEHLSKNNASKYLQQKIKKLSQDNICIVSLINKMNNDLVNLAEKLLIKIIGRKDKKQGPLLNMTDGGDGLCGYVATEETRQKLSMAGKGRVPWIKGKHLSQEAKERIRQCSTGRIHSDEAKEKISQFHKGKRWRLGQKNSIEQNIAISKANTGNVPSKATKDKMRDAKLKNPTRYWLNKEGPNKGKIMSEEQKKKIIESNKRTWRKNHG
jgi:hypothetical protein